MDFYALYHNICNLDNLIEKHPMGSEKHEQLVELVNQISTKKYRVAVIGEFKRGKSSLVNCILGTEILPTDILPTTAVINRIVYDTEQKIDIYYKDGRTEISDIDSLAQYATKLDKEKEKFAETIREIVVHYPSVFSQNSIELLDTPGLNDNESMTETTLQVLDKIDTAIVVISATSPLSESEKRLICELIEQVDIYHLTFVVTFIDRVSEDAEEQDRLVEVIKKRLENDTYKLFCDTHNDSELVAKAEKILVNPAIFAVSSKQAMDGFIKGDNSLIKKSRFKHFKIQLNALLTANQEKDMLAKTKRISQEISQDYKSWHDDTLNNLSNQISTETEKLNECTYYLNNAQGNLINSIQAIDNSIENTPLFSDGQSQPDVPYEMKKIFIKHLSQIRKEFMGHEALNSAIFTASNECYVYVNNLVTQYKETILTGMQKVEDEFLAACAQATLDITPVKQSLEQYLSNTTFPNFMLNSDSIMNSLSMYNEQYIVIIEYMIQQALEAFIKNITDYLNNRRAMLFNCYAPTVNEAQNKINKYQNCIYSLQQLVENENSVYPANQSEVDRISTNILNVL